MTLHKKLDSLWATDVYGTEEDIQYQAMDTHNDQIIVGLALEIRLVDNEKNTENHHPNPSSVIGNHL